MEVKDVVLTDEIKAKIKGFTGFKPESSFKYVPKVYREKGPDGEYVVPKEYWPIFTLRGMDGVEATRNEDNLEVTYDNISDGNISGSSMRVNSGKTKILTCQRGIISWRNLRYDDGSLVKVPTKKNGVLDEDALRHLPPALITELANAITEQTKLSDEELLGLE